VPSNFANAPHGGIHQSIEYYPSSGVLAKPFDAPYINLKTARMPKIELSLVQRAYMLRGEARCRFVAVH
jgi:hypothetical protein